MLNGIEVLPHVDDGLVRFEVEVRFRVFDSRGREVVLGFAKQDGGDAPVRVEGIHPDEGEIEGFGLLDGLKEAHEGRQGHAATRFLDGFPDRGED